jgi:hypothetical protein
VESPLVQKWGTGAWRRERKKGVGRTQHDVSGTGRVGMNKLGHSSSFVSFANLDDQVLRS